jgi:hypothetical protein
MKKARKSKKVVLKGFLQTGTIFIGDVGYMADGNHHSAEPIAPDPLNPFKDLDTFLAETTGDKNIDLPGSYNGDLPGRGVVIQTNMFSGKYVVTKRICKVTGKLLEIKVKFHE